MHMLTICTAFFSVICCSDDQFGQTPLCVAAYHGNETMVEFLMQSGADIDGKFSDANNYEMNWKVQLYVCDLTCKT